MSNKLSILVVSYDGYSDMWDTFFELLEKNWSNKTAPVYLANNEKEYERASLKVIHGGKDAQWSTRTYTALNDVDSEYVCLLLEDFFIADTVDNDEINRIVDFMEKENISYYKLQTFSRLEGEKYKGIPYLTEIRDDKKYGVSLLAAIWKREDLIRMIGKEDYNAWQFEIMRNEEDSHSLSGKCVFDNRDVLHICHGVVKGKYLPEAIREMKKKGYVLNAGGEREILSIKERFEFKLKLCIKNLCPESLYTTVKALGRKAGFKFTDDK